MFRYQYDSTEVVTTPALPGAKFSDLGSSEQAVTNAIAAIREDLVGGAQSGHPDARGFIKSPVDQRLREILYADYTASGRALGSIEKFVQEKILPWYGNTHSVASGTARQSTFFREEARHVIRNYFNCTESNAVIFAGSGVTAAIARFIGIVDAGIREGYLTRQVADHSNPRSHLEEDRWGSLMCSLCNLRVKNEHMFRSHCHTALHQEKLFQRSASVGVSGDRKILILLDSRNHHSALLPFRELGRRHVGTVSVLELSLAELHAKVVSLISTNTLIICVMCAMSNVTGEGPTGSQIYSINESVHSAGGICCWDLATFVSHENFDMNPPTVPTGYTDFAFVSSHKLVGGPGASGLLLARRDWMKNQIPCMPGGGVVFFASAKEESYIQNSQEREEAGTPDIVGCVRAGLVFSLHAKLDFEVLKRTELNLAQRIVQRLKMCPNIILLSDAITPIISFNVEFAPNPNALLLHHNFVVAVLNDLFGLQVRGGCACAGPFAQELLGLVESTTSAFHSCLQQSGQEVFRPGFVRVGVHWTMTERDAEVIAEAISWVAKNGWRLLSVYSLDLETGEWKHRISNHDEERIWLSGVDFFNVKPPNIRPAPRIDFLSQSELFTAADAAISTMHQSVPLESVRGVALDQRFKDLVWFAMPLDSKNAQLHECPLQADSPRRTRIVHPVEKNGHALSLPIPSPPLIAEPIAKKQKKFDVPRKLRALTTSAIIDYNMIKEGDRVLIGISGGKDSLSLLHLLLACQKKCPFRFEIVAATVDPQVPEYNPEPLKGYMQSLGVKYHYLSQPIVEIAKTAMTGKQSICAFCSRMKRGMLYSCMRQNNYNVLALGQHLDDLVESFLMSSFRNGSLRTMKANYFVKERDLRVIRPLIYVREKMTDEFANEARLPIIRDNCPACFAAPKERHRIKLLLSNEEFQNNHLFASMLQAMKPLIGITSALSTKDLIEGKQFPIQDDEEDDQVAEETLLPCAEGSCVLPSK